MLATVAGAVAFAASHAPSAYAAPPKGDAEQALRTGRYEQARRLACGAGRGRAPVDTATLLLCARAELALGRTGEARKRLEAAAEARADDLAVRDALMRLYDAVGDRAALAPLIDASYADWNGGKVTRTRPADLIAIATAVRLDGNWKDANDVLRDAVRANPRATAANLDWGDVLLQKHNAADAEAAFKDVLKVDPDNPDARVGLARVAVADRYDGATALEEIGRALAINPAHAGALALRAALALDAENWSAAAADVAAIRRTNPQDIGATRVAAAAALLVDDRAGYERARAADLAARRERRRVLCVRRGDADAPPPLRRCPRRRARGNRRGSRRRRLPGGPGDDAAAAGRRGRRPRRPPTRLETRPLRRPHLQPAEPVREGDPRPLHHHLRRAAALSHSHRRPRRRRGGRRALPGRALPRPRRPLPAGAARPADVRALRRSRRVRGAHDRPARDRRRRRVLRPCHHLAGADEPCLQLGDGPDTRARARVRHRAVAVARPALVHRRPLRGRDRAPAARMDAPRRRRAVRRASPRRAADAAVAVQRVRDRAGRRGGAGVCAGGGGRRFPGAPVRVPGAARGAGGVRPRRSRGCRARQDDGDVGGGAGARVPRRAHAALRALRQAIPAAAAVARRRRRVTAQGRERPRLGRARPGGAAHRERRRGEEGARTGAGRAPAVGRRPGGHAVPRGGARARATRRRRRRGGVRGPAGRRTAAPRRVRGARAPRARGDSSQAPRGRRDAPAPGRRARPVARRAARAAGRDVQEPAANRRPAASSSRRRSASTRRPTAWRRRWCSGRPRRGGRRASPSWRRSRSSSIPRTPTCTRR